MEPAEDNFGDSTWSLVTTRALSLASTSTPAVSSASTINLVLHAFFQVHALVMAYLVMMSMIKAKIDCRTFLGFLKEDSFLEVGPVSCDTKINS